MKRYILIKMLTVCRICKCWNLWCSACHPLVWCTFISVWKFLQYLVCTKQRAYLCYGFPQLCVNCAFIVMDSNKKVVTLSPTNCRKSLCQLLVKTLV